MYITKELLTERNACSSDIEFFEKIFPDGVEMNDENILKFEKVPANFVWWLYNNICQDKRLYLLVGVHKSKGVNRSEGVYGSEGVNGSNGVDRSDGVDGSNGVYLSNGVDWSDGVDLSEGVNRSNGVYLSKGVNWSDGVTRSKDVNGSNSVNWSEGVNNSFGVHLSNGVSNSMAVHYSFGILDSVGIANSLFCVDISGRYLLFNQQVTDSRINEVETNLYNILDGWRPTYNNIKSLYLQNGSDWKLTPMEDAKEIQNREAWMDMPKAAVNYLKSLPEFDPEIFKIITNIEV